MYVWQEPATLAVPVDERDHSQGPESAAVTLVEYGDYQCSYCGKAHPIVKQLQGRMGERLRFVFRNFPLPQLHEHAEHAAEAAEIAAESSKFWEMHDLLYEHQDALDDESLRQYALQLGLDGDSFAQALEAGAKARRVRQDYLGGVSSGVSGTPTFFINGKRHDNYWDFDTLLAALESAEAPAAG